MFRLKNSIIVCLAVLCGHVTYALATTPIPVFVSIAPQAYFVQQIGKGLVEVHVMVEPGANPHTYEPKPQQLTALSRARLYFSVGIEFEKAKLEKMRSINPNLRVVETDHGILKLPMTAHGHHSEHHPSTKTDDHDSRDPHIWLSPPLVMLQARMILIALQAEDPDHRTIYETNYRNFILDIVDLDADLRAMFSGLQGASFMAFHPSWGTFAHTYGLQQVPIEVEGKQPKPAQLQELIAYAQRSHIKVVFVQPQFSTKSAEQIARAIDGRVVAVDPLAEDWAANLRRVAEEFRHAFR